MRHRLSLTARELTRSGRSPKTYGLRLLVAFLALSIGAFVAFLLYVGTVDPEVLAIALGGFIAGACLVFQFTVVGAVTPFLTAGLIAEEREGDTLSLLMMADMRCIDIYLAKFVSAYIQVEMLLLSTLPLLAAAAFLGGVSVPIVTMQVIMLSATAAFLCALGLFCSALVKSGRQALFLFIVFAVVWLGATIGIDMRLRHILSMYRVNPFLSIVGVDVLTPKKFVAVYVCVYAVACIVVSFAVLKVLPMIIYGRPRGPRFRTGARYPWGKGFLPMDRLAQLFAANAGGADFSELSRFSRSFVVIVFMAVGGLVFFGWIFVALALALHVSTSMASAQRRGLLPDMLVTPVAESKLARSIYHANITRTLLFAPGIAVAELSMFLVVVGIIHAMMVGGPTNTMTLYLSLPILLVLGPARYVTLVTLTCAFSPGYRNPLWQGLRGMLVSFGVTGATYGTLYAYIFLGLPWPETEAGGMFFATGFILFATLVCVATTWWAYRRFAQALWGRLPQRSSGTGSSSTTSAEPASAV